MLQLYGRGGARGGGGAAGRWRRGSTLRGALRCAAGCGQHPASPAGGVERRGGPEGASGAPCQELERALWAHNADAVAPCSPALPAHMPLPPAAPLLPCQPAGSAITGPVAKECADLWPRVAAAANTSECRRCLRPLPLVLLLLLLLLLPPWLLLCATWGTWGGQHGMGAADALAHPSSPMMVALTPRSPPPAPPRPAAQSSERRSAWR